MDGNIDVITALANSIRFQMLAPVAGGAPMFALNSCVAATRLLIDALDRTGIAGAVPVPVFVTVRNAEAATLLDKLDKTTDPDEREAIARQLEAGDGTTEGGPWSLGLGNPVDEEGRYLVPAGPLHVGHVVVGLGEMSLIVDPSIDQVDRPMKGISIPLPLLFQDAPDQLFTTPGSAQMWEDPSGTRFEYRRTRQHLYRTSPQWNRMHGVPGQSVGGLTTSSQAVTMDYSADYAHIVDAALADAGLA